MYFEGYPFELSLKPIQKHEAKIQTELRLMAEERLEEKEKNK